MVILQSSTPENDDAYSAVSPGIKILSNQAIDPLKPQLTASQGSPNQDSSGAKTTPGSRQNSNRRRSKQLRNRSGPGSTVDKSGPIGYQRLDGSDMPEIPRKVIGIVALDVIESYGPVDMVNFKSPENSDPAQRHIVAVKETTLYEA